MERKTFSLGTNLIEKIQEIQDQTTKNGTNLDASTIVRLALLEGLPILLKNLALEYLKNDNAQRASQISVD